MENNQWFSKTREILNKLHDLKGIDSNKYGDVRAVFIYHVVIQYKADIDDVITELFECLKTKLTDDEWKVIDTHYSRRKTIGYYMSIFDMLLISFGVEKIKNLQKDGKRLFDALTIFDAPSDDVVSLLSLKFSGSKLLILHQRIANS